VLDRENRQGKLGAFWHTQGADKRLDQVARDFVQHYSTAWESGKAI